MATITCEKCGSTRTHCPSNTKLCRLCALERDLAFWGTATRKCRQLKSVRGDVCGAEFMPVVRGDVTCGTCARSIHQGDCRICEATDTHLLVRDLAVCLSCAKDPAKRTLILDALAKKRAARMAT